MNPPPSLRSAHYIHRKLQDINTPSQNPKTKRKHTQKRISLVYHKKYGDLLTLELTKRQKVVPEPSIF